MGQVKKKLINCTCQTEFCGACVEEITEFGEINITITQEDGLETVSDLVKEYIEEHWLFDEPTKICCVEHQWAGSGVPGGSSWCSICDIDYDENLIGVWKK